MQLKVQPLRIRVALHNKNVLAGLFVLNVAFLYLLLPWLNEDFSYFFSIKVSVCCLLFLAGYGSQSILIKRNMIDIHEHRLVKPKNSRNDLKTVFEIEAVNNFVFKRINIDQINTNNELNQLLGQSLNK
jgi:hypothetical protein